MRDYMTIGPTPAEEKCADIRSPDYPKQAKIECRAFMHQVIRELGEPPDGATLKIKSFPHDFGSYYELAVCYDDENEQAMKYAFHVEANSPMNWDDQALKELKEAGYGVAAHA